MQLEDYRVLTRYFACFVFSFFSYQFISGIFSFSKHKLRSSIWHILMCLSTALYCFSMAINTHFFTQAISNSFLPIFWILAYSSYYCYLRAIEAYLGSKVSLLLPSKVFCLFLSSLHLVNLVSALLFDKNYLFFDNSKQVTLFARAMNFSITPAFGTLSVGAVGVIVVIYSSYIIWSRLKLTSRKEYMLQIGISLSVLSVFNDSALGLELSGSLIPLYYIGNAFEAVRLNFHYQNIAYERIHHLESEVDELSKVAQFGLAAANISHDIKNHLMIIKYSLKKLARTNIGNKEVEKSIKYTDQISEVTRLYTNLFKYNDEISNKDELLVNIINDALEMLGEKVNRSQCQIEVLIDDNSSISCHRVAFTLCVVNLIANSLDEIGHAKDSWIRIEQNKRGDLLVKDSGHGIPSHIARHIFEVNFSTKKSASGHGLGLAISKHLLSKSGYDIYVDSSQENTTFVIGLLQSK